MFHKHHRQQQQHPTNRKEFPNYVASMEKLTKINANERNYNCK